MEAGPCPSQDSGCSPWSEERDGTTIPRLLCAEPGAASLALRDRGRLVLEQMSAEYLGESARREGSAGQEEYLGPENYACVREALREWLWKVRDAWAF